MNSMGAPTNRNVTPSPGAFDKLEEKKQESKKQANSGTSIRTRFFSRSFSRSASSTKNLSNLLDSRFINKIPQLHLDTERFKLLSLVQIKIQGFLWMKSAVKAVWRKKPDFYEIRGTLLLQYRLKSSFGLMKRNQNNYHLNRIIDLSDCSFDRLNNDEPIFSVTRLLGSEESQVLFAAHSTDMRELWIDALKSSCFRISLSNFELIARIGEGEWGNVYVVRNVTDDGCISAVKEIEVGLKSNINHIIHERHIMGSIPPHPFVVNLYSAFRIKNFIYLVMDFAAGGDLFSRMQKSRPSKAEAILYSAEILLALEHCHKHNVVYRDLKPENLLLGGDGHILLADMGLAKPLREDEYTYTFCGTESYLAPEILNRSPYRMSVDFWQFGCVVFELYCGRSPFWKPRHLRQNLHETIRRGAYKFPASVPDAAKEMIKDLLIVNPVLRAGCDGRGWAAVKSYPYYKRTSFDLLLRNASKPSRVMTEDLLRRYINNFDEMYTSVEPKWGSWACRDGATIFFEDELLGFDLWNKKPDELEG